MVDNSKIVYDIDRQANVSAHPKPVLRAIERLKYYPSILKMSSCSYTNQGKTHKTLQNLDEKKNVNKMAFL